MAPALLCLVVLGALAFAIIDSDRTARQQLDRAWTERVRSAAAALDSMLEATALQATANLDRRYRRGFDDRALELDARAGGLLYAAVATLDGRRLAGTRGVPVGSLSRAAAAMGEAPKPAYWINHARDDRGRPVIEWVTPFRSRGLLRLHVSGAPLETASAFFGRMLAGSRADRAVLVDRDGVRLGDSEADAPLGERADPATLADTEERSAVSAPVGRVPLRVVLLQSREHLYAPLAGSRRWLNWLILAVAGGALAGALLLLFRLASSNHALLRTRERYALALRGAKDGLWDWDMRTGEVHLSGRWSEMLGISGDLGGRIEGWLDRVHPDDRPGLVAAIEANVAGLSDVLDCEHRLLRGDGTWVWVQARGAALFDAEGHAFRMAGSLTDVTARRDAVARLEHQANHDPLTGLANRKRFFELLERAADRSSRGMAPPCAVVYVDLDAFKAVNDRHGHLVGDRVLIEAARRLEDSVRPGDVVARLGGDELAVLVARVRDAAEAEVVARRLTAALRRRYELGRVAVDVGASAGVAVAGGGEPAEELVQLADAAMYRAKLAA